MTELDPTDFEEMCIRAGKAEAALAKAQEALSLFDEYVRLSDAAWGEDGNIAAMYDEPSRKRLDHVRDLFRRADEVKAKIRALAASGQKK